MSGTILLVDDTIQNLQVLETLLTTQGYEVRLAVSGSVALTKIAVHPPDLILLDVMMPEMDGFEVCAHLKASALTSRIPVIFLTALDDLANKIQAFTMGGVDYITKPFQAEEVLARVENQLTIQRLYRQLEAVNHTLEVRVQQRTEALRERILYHPLTHLPSRTYLMQELEQVLQNSMGAVAAGEPQDSDPGFALLLLDCDKFNLINGSLGHTIGDTLLVALSQRLQQCCQPEDFLAHLGEDDFCFLLRGIRDAETVAHRAELILKSLVPAVSASGYEVFMTASIGIVLSHPRYQSALDMMRDADTAVYKAKGDGRNGFHIFDQANHTLALERLHLENDLRRALHYQEFEVFYQPIIELKSGRIWAFEALLRWLHPQKGLLTPGDFLDCLEDCGLMVPVGRWVLTQACQALRQWQQDAPLLRMSVNLSTRQFSYPLLVPEIDQIVTNSGIREGTLKLEITESSILTPQTALEVIEQLRQRHIALSIDDFGTGYSSLSYLQTFPVDSLKIDRSFIQNLTAKPEITRAIIQLGQALGMQIIAEGVETAPQLDSLRHLHCDYGQGFWFSPPLSAAAATEILHRQIVW